ncbi:MAG: histidine kinase [Rhodomicrobium sp.]|nr:histidine kinase [Rhodomicrobium sp.]
MRRTRTLHYTALLTCFIACAGAAGCGGAPGLREGVDGAFIRAAPTWDLNHDGNVTCEEWRAYAAGLFKEADLNRDGKLDASEFGRLAKTDRLFELANFQYYNSNNQGYVTLTDFTERPNPAFQELDKERRCVLNTPQLRAATSDEPKRENPAIPGSR